MKKADENNKDNDITKKNILRISFVCGALSFILIIVFIFLTDESKVFDVSIVGNYYLDDQEVLELSEINDNYYLNIPLFIENNIKSHPLIEDAHVSLLENNIININIKEKKIVGYYLSDEGNFEVLTSSNEAYTLNEDEIYIISNIPLIGKLDEDKIDKFCLKLGELDSNIIKQISEINLYPFSYDPNMYEFVMNDGNYCFVSLNDIDKIYEYYSISYNIDQDIGHACIYIGDFTISAYASTCPWQQ